jgi:hypothetical protein
MRRTRLTPDIFVEVDAEVDVEEGNESPSDA